MPPKPTVVVPLVVFEQETVPERLASFLSPLPVVLLGIVKIPGQTAPKQAREQFEEEARRTLDTVAETFSKAGADVETRLSFTHNPRETTERVAADIDRVSVLITAPTAGVKDVLVAVRGGINVPGIASTVGALVDPETTDVTVYHAAEAGGDPTAGEQAVAGVVQSLEDAWDDTAGIRTRVEHTEEPLKSLVRTANEYDFLVVGEDKPTLTDRIFGTTSEQMVKQVTVPVLIVRRPPD